MFPAYSVKARNSIEF